MKRIFGITMAAICALTVAAFGISACSDEETASDEVTEEEWLAALDLTNAYNVTVNATSNGTSNVKYSDGTTATEISSGTAEIKLALTASGTSSYVTGNTYFYNSNSYSYTSTDEEDEDYDYTSVKTEYEVFTANSYSDVYKNTYSDEEEDYWYGYTTSGQQNVNYSDAYAPVSEAFEGLSYLTSYSDFVYSNGAYRYTDTYDGDTYSFVVKINDGYLSYLSVDYTETYSSYALSYTTSTKYEYNFSDYGTTTVEVPEEYTYEYYLANHA